MPTVRQIGTCPLEPIATYKLVARKRPASLDHVFSSEGSDWRYYSDRIQNDLLISLLFTLTAGGVLKLPFYYLI